MLLFHFECLGQVSAFSEGPGGNQGSTIAPARNTISGLGAEHEDQKSSGFTKLMLALLPKK